MSTSSELATLAGFTVDQRSFVDVDGATFFLAREDGGGPRLLAVIGNAKGFAGRPHDEGDVLLCPLSANNAAALRSRLPWLRPSLLGLRTSAGFGDRLGMATPGHVRSIRALADGPEVIAPVFAQQSVRENQRTGRSPQQVMDDAMWGVFQEGWRQPWGADADHLKTVDDIGAFVDAGYTFFTIDPGDHVDDTVDGAGVEQLEVGLDGLPWAALETSRADSEVRFLTAPIELAGASLEISREQLWRAAVKYGAAVAHTAMMYRHLQAVLGDGRFELEVSVDETATPTSVAEHVFIAAELSRLGVQWVSLAPRFVGSFEKGVDYIGDRDVFAAELALHAAVARTYGPYKLSLHSGSDKFSIYPIAAELATDQTTATPLAHVKTAGTSYLEALRATANTDPVLFRRILDLARDRWATDRATYHVSAELAEVPAASSLSDTDLPVLLDSFDARQVLHVTFGSVLEGYGDELRALMGDHEEVHFSGLERHFKKHLEPFVTGGRRE